MDGVTQKSLEQMLRDYDLPTIALDIMHRVETLLPMDVPPIPTPSPQLKAVLDAKPPESVPDDLRVEVDDFTNARMARANAKAENERRLRSLLWAEQYLRMKGRKEHELLAAFNREAWGLAEPAAADVAERELQVKAHA